MPTLDKRIARQFQRMEVKKQKLFSQISDLSMNAYLQNPDVRSWSAAQIINHLYRSEMLSLGYLKKKMSYPETIPTYSWMSWRSYYFAHIMLLSPWKVNAPPGIDMWKIDEVLLPDTLNEEWNKLRTEMKTYLSETFPAFGNMLVYNHPFAGRMTMEQMLMFFNDHIDHHARQLRRVLRKIKK
jgi:uncharacterized damage-inducible protein DinB